MIVFLSSLFSLPKKSWNIRIRKISLSAYQPHLCPPSHTRVIREHIWHWYSWQVGHRDVFGKELDEYFFVLSCQRNFRFLVEDWSFLQNLHVPISPRPCKIPLTSNMSQIVTMLKVLVHSGYNENLSITFVARLIFVIDHLFLSPLSWCSWWSQRAQLSFAWQSILVNWLRNFSKVHVFFDLTSRIRARIRRWAGLCCTG